MTHEQLRQTCEGLINNTVEDLILGTGPRGIPHWSFKLIKCLENNTSLTSLAVLGIESDVALEKLATVVGHLPHLKHVVVEGVGLDDSTLLLMLPAFRHLKSLRLHRNKITHVGAMMLTKFLLEYKIFSEEEHYWGVFSQPADDGYEISLINDRLTKGEEAAWEEYEDWLAGE